MAVPGGYMYRRSAVTGSGLAGVGPGLQQQLNDCQVTVLGGDVERRGTVAGFCLAGSAPAFSNSSATVWWPLKAAA